MAVGNITITHLSEQERYRAELDEGDDGPIEAGYIDYTLDGDRLALTHTVVYERFGGRGIAGVLVSHVLDDIRQSGRKVVPVCSYVRSYVDKHPEYADLVAE